MNDYIYQPLTEVIVNRHQWARGEKVPKTALKNQYGMCCLGFLALKLGFSEADIFNCLEPEDCIRDKEKEIPGFLEYSDGRLAQTNFCIEAMGINDDSEISDEQRERLLQELTDKQLVPFQFKFVD